MDTETKVIVSGQANGSGSDKWRSVTRLSREAKDAIADKSALVICPRRFDDHDGPWYVVIAKRYGGYDHRLPTTAEADAIAAAGM